MDNKFEIGRFRHIRSDRVKIEDYRFGHNEQGELNVWIETTKHGKRFLWQVFVEGGAGILNIGISTKYCYILCEKTTDRYFFLDINDNGIWLYNDTFFGAETYHIAETEKIQTWLADTLD